MISKAIHSELDYTGFNFTLTHTHTHTQGIKHKLTKACFAKFKNSDFKTNETDFFIKHCVKGELKYFRIILTI